MNTDELANMFDEDLLTPDVPDTAPSQAPETASSPGSEPEPVVLEAVPEPAPEVAETASSTTEPEPEPKAPDTVPLATFLETKNEIKTERERNQELSRRLDTVMEMVNRQQKPVEPEAPAEPVNEINPDEDLVGYLKRENELLTDRVNALAQNVQGTAHVAEGQAAQNAFMHNLGIKEQQFRDATPDYDSAIDHIRSQERQSLGMYLDQLIVSGRAPQMDAATREQTVEAQLRRNELQAAWMHDSTGINPAEAIYNLAKTRGYAPKSAETASSAPDMTESPEAKRIREKTEQQAATQTLGSGGAELTRDVIESGTYDEFQAALKGRGFG